MAEHQPQITIIIAAQYASVRAGLRAIVESHSGFIVQAEAQDDEELARVTSQLAPDIILIDYNDLTGSAMTEIAADDGAAVVVLGAPPARMDVLITSAQNGLALLAKEAGLDEIVGAIRSAYAGLVTLDRDFLSVVSARDSSSARREFSSPTESDLLSARERQVLQLLSQGLPNKQIATKLSISQHTVKFHVAAILSKLGASSRTEAVTLGVRRGEVVL